jgi:competence protein ComFC
MFRSKILQIFLDKIFNDCLLCENEAKNFNNLCSFCFSSLEKYHGCFLCPLNEICSCEFKAFIPFFYNEPIRNLVLKFKYNQKFFLADFFAEMIYENTKIRSFCDENTIFVSIPTTISRLFSRSYNQSVLLSKSLAEIFQAKSEHFIFKKEKYTTQTEKNSSERFYNAQSFTINDVSPILNQNVCIVDDIIASGNTILKCIDLLKPFAKKIFIASVAKT